MKLRYFWLVVILLQIVSSPSDTRADEPNSLKIVSSNSELIAAIDQGYSRIVLNGSFSQITLNRAYPSLLIMAHSAIVQGVRIVNAQNVEWIGGRIEASGGADATGPAGYAMLIQGSKNIRLSEVNFRNFNRGIVGGSGTQDVSITNNHFSGRQDGIIYSGGVNVTISYNTFEDFTPRPTTCVLPNGVNKTGLSSRDCGALGGTWTDGDHSDAIQFRNGCDGFTVAHNRIINVQQGIGQMDSTNDLPVKNFKVIGNEVQVLGFHSITFNTKPNQNILVVNNTVIETTSRKTPLRLPGEILSYGNVIIKTQ
jgi:hypothetical protein